MHLKLRNIVTGLEGCGKSSKVFEYLKDLATTDRPILFGVKNYKLMTEQIDNWVHRYNIPRSEFSVNGFSRNYDPALQAYDNPEEPSVVRKGVRFVFTSQANIQRRLHTQFSTDEEEFSTFVEFSHIVLDEFDYSVGFIPTLDYELNTFNEESAPKTVDAKLKWIEKNYTVLDKVRANSHRKNNTGESFLLATWVEFTKVPLTILSSETLAVELCKAIGFEVINLGEATFKEQVINTQALPKLNKHFFAILNKDNTWDSLPYDLIITDKVRKYYETSKEQGALDVLVVPHAGVRGSNSYRGKSILTVLSYIPPSHIQLIKDTLNAFGIQKDYKKVEQLFYRDRLCQAVGRVLGFRSTEEVASTDLLIPQALWNILKDYDGVPYTLKPTDTILTNTDYIAKEIAVRQRNAKYKHTYVSSKENSNKQYLRCCFRVEKGSFVSVKDAKTHVAKLLGVPCTGPTVAKEFGLKISNKRVNGDQVRGIRGLVPLTEAEYESKLFEELSLENA